MGVFEDNGGNYLQLANGSKAIEVLSGVTSLDNGLIYTDGSGSMVINNDLNVNRDLNVGGNLRVNGEVWFDRNYWNDVSSSIIDVATTAQAPTWDSTYMTYYFHDDVLALQDYVFVEIQLPHSYKQGSDLYCHIHWSPSSTNTGDANFSLSYTWTNLGDTQSATPTVISAKQSGSGTAHQQELMSFPVISGAGKNISSVLKAKLMRESASTSDTFTGDAYVSFFDCHYLIDSVGSRSMGTK